MKQRLPRYDLPVPVFPGWGGRSRSSPLMLLLSLHGSIHLQPEYYANWTRCLQSMTRSPSLCYCSHDRSSSCWLYIQLWWYSFPLPLPPPSSFSLSINLFKTQDSQLILSARFQLIIHAVPFFSLLCISSAFLAYSSLPFFLFAPWMYTLSLSSLSNCCLSPSSQCVLPSTVYCHLACISTNPLVLSDSHRQFACQH